MPSGQTLHTIETKAKIYGHDLGVAFLANATIQRISKRAELAQSDDARNAYEEAIRIIRSTREEIIDGN